METNTQSLPPSYKYARDVSCQSAGFKSTPQEYTFTRIEITHARMAKRSESYFYNHNNKSTQEQENSCNFIRKEENKMK